MMRPKRRSGWEPMRSLRKRSGRTAPWLLPVISTAISELARCACKDLSGALHQLDTLTSGPWWHVWCSTVGRDAEDLGAALEKRLERGEAHTLPRSYVEVEAERTATD